MNFPIYIGYDQREHAAYIVCKHSIEKKVWEDSPEFDIYPLAHKQLRRNGQFDRPWLIDEKGQYWDRRDGRPFSTEFSHSRFLTPRLAYKAGYRDLAMFVDCDFMFMVSPSFLFEAIDRSKVVSCVKFSIPIPEGTKMDGMMQQNYSRKLWSSLMVFNLAHKDIGKFLELDVNSETGREMHNFLDLADEDIGEIDPRWNYIPGLSAPTKMPNAIHWSMGGPWMDNFSDVEYSQKWFDSFHAAIRGNLYGKASSILFPIL